MASWSFPLTLPDHADIEQFTMSPLAFVSAARSPFTGKQQVQAFPGQLWQADVTISMLAPGIGADLWTSFLTKLNGREGTFLMGDPWKMTPRGYARIVPIANVTGVNTVDQLSIICSAGANQARYLAEGDYIQLGTGGASHLHKVMFDAATDANGVASLQLWPRLRYVPSSGEVCYVQSCVGIWRLADNTMPWTESSVIYSDIAFKAIEDPGA